MSLYMCNNGGIDMKKVFLFTGRAISTIGKALLASALLVGTLVMNFIGVLICAITE